MSAAAGMVMRVMPTHVSDARPADEPAESLLRSRPQHQMPMIAHQTPAEQIDGITFQSIGEDANERIKVGRLVEEIRLAVAPIEHVIITISFDGATGTGACRELTNRGKTGQSKSDVPLEFAAYDGDGFVPNQTTTFAAQTAPAIGDPSFESGMAGNWQLNTGALIASDSRLGGYDGTYAGLLSGGTTAISNISQAVAGFTAGLYQISFLDGGTDQFTSPDPVDISIDGTIVATIAPPNGSDQQFESVASPSIYIPAGTHTLAFSDAAGIYGNGTFIDSVSITGVAGTYTPSNGIVVQPDPTLLRAKTTTDYDDQGRPYASHVFSVNPSNGDVSPDSIDTNSWYDARGNVIKTQTTKQAATKTAYDGVDRPTIVSTTDAGGDAAAGTTGNWSDAGNVTGDTVLEQDGTTYDADSNPIEMVQRQRFNTDTGTGALGGPTSTNAARVYYTSSFYDGANRLTATANVGTSGGSAYTRPSSVPSRSDTTLVTSYTYNPAGWVNEVTDPRGIITKTDYDALGRTTHTIADYTDGTPTNSSNQTTAYTYDGDDHVLTQTAVLPDDDEQETKYIYGVTTASGSSIDSNDILAETDYPDLDTGEASSDEAETYTTDALGERTSMTDRNGNVHVYTYDVLGRQTLDAVTTLGDGVDGTIRAIGTAYNSAGQPYLHTSYSNAAATTVANQVEDIYNGLGQMIGEYQSHSSAVSIGTTPEVQWGYSTIANGSRKSDLVYPNGRQVDYNYASGLDSSISRLTSESDDSTSTVLESYKYLGMGTVVERDHPEDGVNLTYISATSTGDGGDQYVGLDRFGRVVDQKWVNSSGTAVDEYQYGYDRDGNVLYKLNTVSTANSELYSYDNLNRLATFERGTLNGTDTAISGTPGETESWGLDALGNWLSNTVNGTETDRTYDHENELVTDGTQSLTYDADGNMLTDEKGYVYTYDAWNRKMGSDGGAAVSSPHVGRGPLYPTTRGESYTYDALGRRINDAQVNLAFYYDGWQDIEDRYIGSPTTATNQYVWSPVYVNAMVERDASGTRLYVTQDANWNATAAFTTGGTASQRFLYDPYGSVTRLNSDFTPYSGVVTVELNYLFQGGKLDNDGMYWFEHRDEDAALGDWAEQDPKEYINGLNRYRPLSENPLVTEDPAGLQNYRPLPPPPPLPTTPSTWIPGVGWGWPDPSGSGWMLDPTKTGGGAGPGPAYNPHSPLPATWELWARPACSGAIGAAVGLAATPYVGPNAGRMIGGAVGGALGKALGSLP